ncbi:MAG: hypothetical protein V1799_03475 [bacterium]
MKKYEKKTSIARNNFSLAPMVASEVKILDAMDDGELQVVSSNKP